jgi:hypothetical protein
VAKASESCLKSEKIEVKARVLKCGIMIFFIADFQKK